MPPPLVTDPPRSLQSGIDLFETLDDWLTRPDYAFRVWLSRLPRKDSTRRVYTAMWDTLIARLASTAITLDQLADTDLESFLNERIDCRLDGKGLHKEHRRRYLRIVEQVFDHMAELGYPGKNPARKAAKKQENPCENDEARFLTPEERTAVIAHIQTGLEKIRNAQSNKEEWLEARNCAMVGALIGAGLKVHQVQGATVNCMKVDEGGMSINLPPRRGVQTAHTVAVLPAVRDLLSAWQAQRTREETGNGYLFPADRERGGPRPRRSDDRLHPASIFRPARSILSACGISGKRACAQTLRNTYAAICIDDGATDEQLIRNMGFVEERSISLLRKSYTQWRIRQGQQGPADLIAPGGGDAA